MSPTGSTHPGGPGKDRVLPSSRRTPPRAPASTRPAGRRPKARTGRGLAKATLLGVVVLAALAAMVFRPMLAGSAAPGTSGQRAVHVYVRLGDTVPTVARRLQSAGVLGNGITALLFEADARIQGLGSHLKAGTYTLTTGMSPVAAVDTLSGAVVPVSVPTVTVTVPEGWRLEQVAHLLAARGLVDEGQFLHLSRQGQFTNDFLRDRPPGATLEGYLFPDTYTVVPTIGARRMIQTMLDQFGRRLSPALRRAARARGTSLYAIVTLASIVEREAVYPAERSLIAGVYDNRLAGHEGGYLNADPTVQYAVGAETYASSEHLWWTRHLTRDQLAVDSPYNTYVHRGLPAGPICSPGAASIKAAINPAATDYNYFFAPPGGGGHSIFCKTLACQNAAVTGQ
ncbi:MAG: endolytic transglycosylase MltG [Chloroflexota bacterium]